MNELIIFNRGKAYFPRVIEPIIFEDELRGSPSKLTFTVVKGENINFQEGNPVRFKHNNEEVFFGFVFTKSRDKDHHIKVVAYDQMRYLKNKNTLKFENKTASEIINIISSLNKPNMNLGKIDDTGFKIKSLIADNKTYMDMIYDALDMTLAHRKKGYVLYDNFGKLTLSDIESLELTDVVITENNTEDFSYTSSIDKETYNHIVLLYEDEKSGVRKISTASDPESIKRWGLLQFHDTLNENENGDVKADILLELYNRKTRNLELKNVKGDCRVRAGFRVMVIMNLGDIILQNYLTVGAVKHEFTNSNHRMSIKVLGGGFNG